MTDCVFCGRSGADYVASGTGKGICSSCNQKLFSLLVSKNKTALESIIEETAEDVMKS